MGQEHSLPVVRRAPNKLSKPRTTSTANLLSRSALHLGGKDVDIPGQGGRYSMVFADPVIRQDTVENVEQPEKVKEKRRSIFRSQSTPNRHSLPSRQPPEEIPSWSQPEESRHHSMVSESYTTRPVIHPRMSLQHVPMLPQNQRLSLVQELATPEPENSNRLSTYGDLRSPTTASIVLPPANSDANFYTPMRRSSFVQHGLATRPSDDRQLLPSQMDAPIFPKPYPHAYLDSLRHGDLPRVETPDELGHTGAFMLGSLRITNGVASPTPSIERATTMSAGEDYISAGNLRGLLDHRRGISSRSNTLSTAGERMKSPWVVREESPLRRSEAPQIDLDLSALADFDFDSTFDLQSPSKSQELANEYMQDIALSPYSFAPSRTPSPQLKASPQFDVSPRLDSSPQLEATSKHTAIEDELFEAEPLTPAASIADSGYGGGRMGSRRQKPLAKADSGYSSNVSLRSFKARAPPVPAKDTTPPRKLRVASTSSRGEVQANASNPTIESSTISTAVVVSQEKLNGRRVRQISIGDVKVSSIKHKHLRSGSDPQPSQFQLPEKKKHYSLQSAPVFNEIDMQDTSRDSGGLVSSFTAFSNAMQSLRRPGNRDTLATIMSVGSGYTEAPAPELTFGRLQAALPPPPSPVTSNSYHPPKTPPRKLQKRSSLTRDMAAYKEMILQDNFHSEHSLESNTVERSQSLQSNMESVSMSRSVSGSRTSSMTALVGLVKKHSYESIAMGNPWVSRENDQTTHLEVEQPERRLSWGNRDKKPPPISMQTQRKTMPTPIYNLFPTPPTPRRPPPISLLPISKDLPHLANVYARPSPPPPHKSLPPSPLPIQMASPLQSPTTPRSFAEFSAIHDPWAEEKSYWSERRQSASDGLQLRPSVSFTEENIVVNRPSASNRNSSSTIQSRLGGRRPPSVHQNGNLRIQRNMENVKAKMMMQSSPDLHRSAVQSRNEELNDSVRQQRQRDVAGEMLAGWQPTSNGSTPSEFYSAYGITNSTTALRSPTYFAQPTVDDSSFSRELHRRQNSTNDMLVLDRYSGGLGYGYEHGSGLSGSAGLSGGGGRKSVHVSKEFGLDFTDVPVFVHHDPR